MIKVRSDDIGNLISIIKDEVCKKHNLNLSDIKSFQMGSPYAYYKTDKKIPESIKREGDERALSYGWIGVYIDEEIWDAYFEQ